MALPRVIEYLLTLKRASGGGPLVTQGQTQIIIPLIAPGQTVTVQQHPYANEYMDILFMWAFDTALVPMAFYAWGSYFGARPWEGIAHSWWMANSTPSFVFITESQPAYALIYNRSPLAQTYMATGSHLAIQNEEDFNEVYKQIDLMATSENSLNLAVEANGLLSQIKDQGVG